MDKITIETYGEFDPEIGDATRNVLTKVMDQQCQETIEHIRKLRGNLVRSDK